MSVSAERYISVVHPRHWFVCGGRVWGSLFFRLHSLYPLIHLYIFQRRVFTVFFNISDLHFSGSAPTPLQYTYFQLCCLPLPGILQGVLQSCMGIMYLLVNGKSSSTFRMLCFFVFIEILEPRNVFTQGTP